jgi:hypothetical protein
MSLISAGSISLDSTFNALKLQGLQGATVIRSYRLSYHLPLTGWIGCKKPSEYVKIDRKVVLGRKISLKLCNPCLLLYYILFLYHTNTHIVMYSVLYTYLSKHKL